MNFKIAKQVIAAAALVLIAADAGAQKMITFESRSVSSHSRRGRSRHDDGKNSLTMGIASMFNGYIPFYYERTLLPMLTVQVGAGITFRSYLNDFGMLLYDDGNNTDFFKGANRSDISDRYYSYKYRKTSLGQYFSIAPKVYFRESALNGAYIGPMLEYKNFRYKAQLADVTVDPDNYYHSSDDRDLPRASQTMDEQMKCLDVTFNIGGHFQASGNLAVGWNVGIGARNISSERLDVGRITDVMGADHFANVARKYTATRPLFVFNFTMGGWF